MQLNSEAAIMKLIEDNPELQFEIKNKISCAVAKGYERIDKSVVDKSVDRITDIVTDKVLSGLTDTRRDGWNYKQYLKQEIVDLINKRVTLEINNTIYTAIDKAQKELQNTINEQINSISERIEKKIMQEAFNNSVRDEVIRRLAIIQNEIDTEVKDGE